MKSTCSLSETVDLDMKFVDFIYFFWSMHVCTHCVMYVCTRVTMYLYVCKRGMLE